MSAEETDLDALLRSAAPVRGPLDEERVFADVWSRIATSMDDDAVTRADLQSRRLDLVADRELAARRRRRATRVASLTLAVALAGAGTAAAGDFFATHTGEELTGWEVDAGGSGEVLNMGGTDRREVFAEVTADIPFPPGYEAQRDYALDSYPVEADSRITESRLRTAVAGYAVCSWADAWIAADHAGDEAARAAATSTLGETPSWEAIRTGDLPDAVRFENGETRSYFGWVPRLADAAASGNHQAVLDAVADSRLCSYHVLPVIDVTPGYRYAGQR